MRGLAGVETGGEAMVDFEYADLADRMGRIPRDSFPETAARLRRAVSWIERAQTHDESDKASEFMFMWIAFNALYADRADYGGAGTRERLKFKRFFRRVLRDPFRERIRDAVWERFSGPVRVIMNNEFVFAPYWVGDPGLEWEDAFKKANERFNQAFRKGQLEGVLLFMFDRLYVLRNQLFHGGATWNGHVNADQVRDGARIMAFLVPEFVNAVIERPDVDWGDPIFPRMPR